MNKSLPYFRWYPADAETDTDYSAMTDTELGFYHRCLNRSWINDGLPADLDELARAMKVSRSYLDRVWGRVGRRFFEADGKLRNKRQEGERLAATTKSERATDAVRTRYERRTNELPRALAPAESVCVSVSSSASEVKEKTSLREIPKPIRAADLNGQTPQRFAEWWAKYPLQNDRDSAARMYLSVVTAETEAAVLACLDRYLLSDLVHRGIVMAAWKWLEQQHRNGWAGDWPKVRDPPKSRAQLSAEEWDHL